MSGKSEFRVDRAKNRLYIKLGGFFRGGDVQPAMDGLEAALSELKPDFDTVTDLSEFVPGSPGATKALTKGGDMVRKKGRRNGVRIAGGLMTGIMQFQRLLKGVFDETNTKMAKSVQEADTMLDNWSNES